jgi:broad specificity phosphatase PhoE
MNSAPYSDLPGGKRTPDDPRALDEYLDALDDVVFGAIEGDMPALIVCESALRQAASDLRPETFSESRLHYLERARAARDALRTQMSWQPTRIIAVLHVIAVLIGDFA